MKVLHTSDWHPDWVTAGVSRFADVERGVMQTLAAAEREKVGLYCFTGDLCDPDAGAVVLQCAELSIYAALRLARGGISSVWVRGNHDPSENGFGTSSLAPLRALQGANPDVTIRVFEEPEAHTIDHGGDTVTVIGLPYPTSSRPYDAAEHLKRLGARCRSAAKIVVATHLQFAGMFPGDEARELARGKDVFFPHEVCDPKWLVLGGHYHERQEWVSPDGRGVKADICGSLARLAHGEERNRPSFTIWEV